MDNMKSYSVYVNQSHRCQLCSVNLDNPKMGNELLRYLSMTYGSEYKCFATS